MAEKKVRIIQVRSAIGQTKGTKATLKGLGLGRIGHSREHKWTPSIAGMAHAVSHLVELDGAAKSAK